MNVHVGLAKIELKSYLNVLFYKKYLLFSIKKIPIRSNENGELLSSLFYLFYFLRI